LAPALCHLPAGGVLIGAPFSSSYAPESLEIEAKQRGFSVERQYMAEDKDHPEFVSRDSDGVWHVKKGAVVRAKLTIVRSSVRTPKRVREF